MQIKRFEASDIGQALMMVKKDFGPNAVILSARTYKKPGGLFNFFNRPAVEITAATDNGQSNYYAKTSHHWKIDDSENQDGIIEQRDAKIRNTFFYEKEKISNKNFSAQKEKNKMEITDSRLHHLYQRMLEHEMDREIALELIRTGQKNKKFVNEDHRPEDMVLIFKEAGIHTSPIIVNRKKEVIAFVGPAGVGKTSSIFKLAALHSLEKKKRVGIITLDSHRIGTFEQLKVFEKIVGVPTYVAFDSKELTACLKKFKQYDLVFIDTPGINPKDPDAINEMKDFLTYSRPTETHLVLSATTKEKDLKDTIDRFEALSIGKLLFTKIDESSTYGPLLNQLYRTQLPLSYVANGQRIPVDIDDATPERLMRLLMNNGEEKNDLLPNRKTFFHTATEESNTLPETTSTVFVSNKKSQFFHHAHCSRVKRINGKNIVIYKSQREANQKGLKPCKMCMKDHVLHPELSTAVAEMR